MMLCQVTRNTSPSHSCFAADPQSISSNSELPVAGTYTNIAPTIAYLELALGSDQMQLQDFQEGVRFRLYMSDAGENKVGDIKIFVNDAWHWIAHNRGAGDTYILTRPTDGNLVNVPVGHRESELDVNGAFRPTDVTFEPFTIEEDAEGLYVASLSFDITNTFFFDDVNNHGVWEPERADSEEEGDDGHADWQPGPPELSLALTKQ